MKNDYSFMQRIILILASCVGPVLLLLYGFTWRIKWRGTENLKEAKKISGKIIYAFWHSRLLGLCYAHRFQGVGIMVSKSFDGEWITRLVTKLGYKTYRGSASKDGASGLLEMIKDPPEGDFALTVDGPKGPAEKVKPGAITLASKAALPVVPITIIAEKAWCLKSWDRFMLPIPFTTITVSRGPHISIPADINKDSLKEYRIKLEKAIADLS
jgi:lysophospholipid acyltransferase (LPLAT)-like uncharacterized protein